MRPYRKESFMTCASLKRAKIDVSVIMPSLNAARYLRQCVESVLNQTLRRIELLCVDAGSTDGTLEILEEYARADPRVRVIRSEKRSYGYQVNLGLQEAQGNYIGIVETDDYLDPSMYQALYSCAGENGWPDFVKGGFTQFACQGERTLFWPARRDRLEELFGCVVCPGERPENGVCDLNHIWAGIYRRGFIEEQGIRLHESPGASYQDLSFSLLTGLLADTALYLEDRFYFYRMDNESSSVRASSKWHCVIDEFHYTAQELLKRGRYSPEVQRLIRGEKLEIYLWNALRLPEKERGAFSEAIQPELAEYAGDDLTGEGREYLELLRDAAGLEKTVERKRVRLEAFQPAAERILAGDQLVLVGAGSYGECLISFQETFVLRFILAVADNDAARQGRVWNQYRLISVEEAAGRYGESCFIVANKLHAAEIRHQLMELGISEDRIFAVQDMILEGEFAELLLGEPISS